MAPARWVLLAIVVVATALRVVNLGADVPYSAEGSEAPVEDAFWYLEAAAGPAEGSQPQHEPYYDIPIWRSVARVWFAAVGASLKTAHLLGALVSLLTLLLFWRVVRAGLGERPALLATAVLAVIYPTVMLSRTPLIYGPVCLASVLAAALWLRSRRLGPWAQAAHIAAAWAIVALLGYWVRPPGWALAGGLALAQLQRTPSLRVPALLALVLGGIGLAILSDPVALNSALDGLAGLGGVFAENAVRLRRKLGPLGGDELLVRLFAWGTHPTAGGSPGFALLAPGATVVAFVGAAEAWADRARLSPARRETLLLFGGWGVAFVAGSLLLSSYGRALRYYVLLAPPIAAFAGYALQQVPTPSRLSWLPGVSGAGEAEPAAPSRDWILGLWVAVTGAFVWPIVAALAFGPDPSRVLTRALGGAVVAGGLWLTLTSGRTRRRSAARVRTLVAMPLVLAATLPGALRSAASVLRPTWQTAEANALLGTIVDRRTATVVGPYASVLSIGNGLRRARGTWITTFPSTIDRTLQRLQAPVGELPLSVGATHMALGHYQERSAQLIRRFAAKGMRPRIVAVFRARPEGPRILLLRFPWADSLGYSLTPYEIRQQADGPTGLGPPERSHALLEVRAPVLEWEGHVDQARALRLSSFKE